MSAELAEPLDDSTGLVQIPEIPYNFEIREPAITTYSTSEIASILQQLGTSSGLPCDGVALKASTVKTVNDKDMILLHLSFENDEQTFDASLAQAFCQAVTAPSSDSIIKKISKGGVLGLSAVRATDLSDCWNMAVFETLYNQGPGTTMKLLQETDLSEADPSWMAECWDVGAWLFSPEVATTIAFVVSGCTTADPKLLMHSFRELDKETLERQVNNAREFMAKIQRQKASKSSTDVQFGTLMTSFPLVFVEGEVVEMALGAMIENVDMSLESQAKVLQLLGTFTSTTHRIMHSTLELHEQFKVWVDATSTTRQAWTAGAAFSGLVSYGIPVAKPLLKGAAGGCAFLGGSMAAYDTWQIMRSKRRRDFTRKLLLYVSQTWRTALECVTLLKLIKMTNGAVHFVNDAAEQWVIALNERIMTVTDEHKTAEMVRVWLLQVKDELAQTRTELMDELPKITV